jgi:hypothetical protein
VPLRRQLPPQARIESSLPHADHPTQTRVGPCTDYPTCSERMCATVCTYNTKTPLPRSLYIKHTLIPSGSLSGWERAERVWVWHGLECVHLPPGLHYMALKHC